MWESLLTLMLHATLVSDLVVQRYCTSKLAYSIQSGKLGGGIVVSMNNLLFHHARISSACVASHCCHSTYAIRHVPLNARLR